MNLPAVADRFYWTPESWGSALRCRALDPVAAHLFTTRQLQLPFERAWRELEASIGVAPGKLLTLRQVHGREVVVVRRRDRSHALRQAQGTPSASRGEELRHTIEGKDRPEADVLVSDDPDVALAVRAADCVLLLIADPRTGAVGAAHAGWRGTAAGAGRAAVEAMQREFGSEPSHLVAAIGPSIGPCCYVVGSELVDAFAAAGHARHLIDRWFLAPPPPRGATERSKLRLDVWAANRDQLMLAGVAEENIHVSRLCTASNLDLLPSYRAEGEKTGRIVGAIRGRAG